MFGEEEHLHETQFWYFKMLPAVLYLATVKQGIIWCYDLRDSLCGIIPN
jgi:hypothetical protein